MEETQKLICRKCNGNHLTIKCNANKTDISVNEIKSEYKSNYVKKPLYKVKIANLPVDMTESELHNLLYDWGHVARMRVLNYDDNATAYVEFKFEDEANYLVSALDKTSFEYIILSVERLYD